MNWAAVTLNGHVIHKSGQMTGGSLSPRNGKKATDRDVQGKGLDTYCMRNLLTQNLELQQTRDRLLSDLRDLAKSKPRSNADEPLLTEIPRLESALSLARDDLVRELSL